MEKQIGPVSSGTSRPLGVRPASSQAAAGMSPKEAVDIIRRHVLLIAVLAIVGFVIGATAWILLLRFYPRYTAWTYIEVLPPGFRDPAKVEMPITTKDIQFQERSSKAALIKQQSLYDELLKRDEIRATTWFAKYKGDVDKLREVLSDDLGATPERDTNYVRVAMTCGSRKESALIVNQVVDIFVSRQTNTAQQGVGGRLGQLNTQLSAVESDLRASENGIEAIRQNAALAGLTGVTGMDTDFRNAISLKLSNLEVQQNDLIRRIAQLRTNVATAQKQVTGPVSPQIQRLVESDPVMISLANQLSALESDLARKRGTLGDDHREVRRTEEAIKRITEQRRDRQTEISETYRQSNYYGQVDELTAMTDELKELDEMRNSAEMRQKDLERYQIIFEQAVSRRDDLRKRRDNINDQITTYKLIYGDPETPQVRRAGFAPEPTRVSSPKWQLYLPGGLVFGLLLGVGLSFLIEMLNDLVRTPSDVKKYLNAPLLGVVYHADEDEQVKNLDMCHVTTQAPHSITAECYRQFRTNLKLSAPPEALKTILVTSGYAGDGKTCTASNLATTFVAEGNRVLFIDANLRRPTSRVVFPPVSSETQFGLTNLLAGQCQASQAIRSSGIEGLDVLDSGMLTRNPTELLGTPLMRQLLAELERSYDHVVIDGPPVLIVSEAKLLAALARSTVLVINATSTTRGTAARALRELVAIHANVVGCMLMQARSLKGGYFDQLVRSYEEYHAAQPVPAGR